MERIIAIVVSHNRHAMLVQAIEAIRNQTVQPHDILVVNNGSADFTSVWLDKQKDIIQITQENKGSAGGYHTGMAWAHKQNYSWLWCMDDDSYPANDALERLLDYTKYNSTISLLNSSVINKTDNSRFVWSTAGCERVDQVRDLYVRGEAFPFNGTLIHRSIVDRVGLPLSQLFFWGEEREYLNRIKYKHKIPTVTVMNSRHYHPSATYSHRNEWDYQTSWKMYFFVRNRYQVLLSKYNNRFVATAKYLYYLAAFCWSIVIFQNKNKLRKMLFAAWPMMDAFRGNYSATPETVIASLKRKKELSIPSLLLWPLRSWIIRSFMPVSVSQTEPLAY